MCCYIPRRPFSPRVTTLVPFLRMIRLGTVMMGFSQRPGIVQARILSLLRIRCIFFGLPLSLRMSMPLCGWRSVALRPGTCLRSSWAPWRPQGLGDRSPFTLQVCAAASLCDARRWSYCAFCPPTFELAPTAAPRFAGQSEYSGKCRYLYAAACMSALSCNTRILLTCQSA